MLSYVFGSLGEVFSPRPDPKVEFNSLIRAGQYDNALILLRKSNHEILLNEKDKFGLVPIHYAAGSGELEFVIELLTQGVDVEISDDNGNRPLHFAAINNHKCIVEILLRSTADASAPTRSGQIPWELTQDPSIKLLLVLDRATQKGMQGLLSPIGIVRQDMISHSLNLKSEMVTEKVDNSELKVIKESNIVMTDAQLPRPISNAKVFAEANIHNRNTLQHHQNSNSNINYFLTHNNINNNDSDDEYNVSSKSTIDNSNNSDNSSRIEINSSPMTPIINKRRSSNSSDHVISLSSRKQEDSSSSDDNNEDEFTLVGIQSAAKKPNGSMNFLPESIPTRINVPDLDLSSVNLGENFLDSTHFKNKSQSQQKKSLPAPPTTDSLNLLALTGKPPLSARYIVKSSCNFDSNNDFHNAVLQAAKDTADAFNCSPAVWNTRYIMHNNIVRKTNIDELKKLLKFDPSLVNYRTTKLSSQFNENTGYTPMHIAASVGNIKVMRLLIEYNASTWVLDLQGRLPLHIAAATVFLKGSKNQIEASKKNQIEMCEFLKEEMRKERNQDPTGLFAPCDLAGNTPLGWSNVAMGLSTDQFRVHLSSPELRNVLYEVGDKSIFVRSPHSARGGKSPWKQSSFENIVFSHSEATGWKESMEDRICIANPLPGRPAWSFFGVFDGHGGSFSSNFLAEEFPILLAGEADIFAQQLGSKTIDDADTTPEILEKIILNTCRIAESSLSLHPRMLVETKEETHIEEDGTFSKKSKISCLDSSGSTAIFAIITSHFVAIGNVGDSRAILASRSDTSSGINSSRSNSSSSSTSSTPKASFTSFSSPITNNSLVPMFSPRNSLTTFSKALSTDHKLSIPEEYERAANAGAIIEQIIGQPSGTYSLQHPDDSSTTKLSMSRSFGDFYLKQFKKENKILPPEEQAVIAIPEILIHRRTST
jgi:ankyrin repeat protein/serine/threonine protein phosphatase PrpC